MKSVANVGTGLPKKPAVLAVLVLAASLGFAVQPVSADPPLVPNNPTLPALQSGDLECGALVVTSVKLTDDIGPCSGDGLVVAGNFIKIDMEGHKIVGDGDPNNAAQVGIRIVDKRGVKVENGTVEKFNAGVFISGGSGHEIDKVTAQDNRGNNEISMGDGILVSGSSQNKITKNVVKRNGADFPFGSTVLQLFGGISLTDESSENVIEHNLATEHGSTGIRLEGGGVHHNVIRENTSTGNGGNGVSLGFDAFDNQVLNNTLTNNKSSGIGTSFGAERAIIRGNTITGNVNGIALGSGTATVENNTVSNNTSNGMSVPGGSLFQSEEGPENFIRKDSVIRGNTVENNGRNGIFVLCPKDFVSQTPPPNGTRGTCLTPANSYGQDISSNHLIENNTTGGNGGALAGIAVKDGSGNVTGRYDLLDQSPTCYTNTWRGNTYTYASPACTQAA